MLSEQVLRVALAISERARLSGRGAPVLAPGPFTRYSDLNNAAAPNPLKRRELLDNVVDQFGLEATVVQAAEPLEERSAINDP